MNPQKRLLDLTGKLPWEEKEKQGRWELKKVMSALHTLDVLSKRSLPGRWGRAVPAREADDSAWLCPQGLEDEMIRGDSELRGVGRCSRQARGGGD